MVPGGGREAERRGVGIGHGVFLTMIEDMEGLGGIGGLKGADLGIDPGIGIETGRENDPETGTETDLDLGTDPETDLETDTEIDPETGPETDIATETKIETAPRKDRETYHGNDCDLEETKLNDGLIVPDAQVGLHVTTDHDHVTPTETEATDPGPGSVLEELRMTELRTRAVDGRRLLNKTNDLWT